MKIASANLQMNSSHQQSQSYRLDETLRVNVGGRLIEQKNTVRADSIESGREAASSQLLGDKVSLSEAALNAAKNDGVDVKPQLTRSINTNNGADAINAAREAAENDPRLALIRAIIEHLTGKKVNVYGSKELQSNVSSNGSSTATGDKGSIAVVNTGSSSSTGSAVTGEDFGAVYSRLESYRETETMQFQSQGSVVTADGTSIEFTIDLSMSREFYQESSEELSIGNPTRTTDPLVINYAGAAADLVDQRFAFDLDSDGKTEKINRLAGGSGFLVFDRNQDGKVNNGKEMFGTESGNGFQDLAALDSDQNGWIDENDAAWSQLGVWTPNQYGSNTYMNLKDAGVGAIALQNVGSEFSLKDSENQLQGQVRRSGIFLHESGEVGTIQQVDLTA